MVAATDGSLRVQKLIGSEHNGRDGYVELVFSDLWKDLSYRILMVNAAGVERELVGGTSYSSLANASGTGKAERLPVTEETQDLDPTPDDGPAEPVLSSFDRTEILKNVGVA